MAASPGSENVIGRFMAPRQYPFETQLHLLHRHRAEPASGAKSRLLYKLI
jgi:hypothetical protein